MMLQAAPPPPAAATAPLNKPADRVVISRDTHSDMLVNIDTPLPLIKAGRTEDAVLRQAISLTSTLTVDRAAVDGGEEVLRWSYVPHLQRQLCFTSITGQFSCATAEVEDLTEKASGETELATLADQATPDTNPTSEAARIALTTSLNTRAGSLFETDRRLKLIPMLKAAGVSVRPLATRAKSVRR